MKKFIPTLIAIVLIIIIGAGVVGSQLMEKYSYSKEKQNMEEYYHLDAADDVAIVLHNERIETKAKLIEGRVYLDFDSVKKLLNNRFYVDSNENWFIYTLPNAVVKSPLNSDTYFVANDQQSFGSKITIVKNDTVYVSLDYVQKFTKFDYTLFEEPARIQLDKVWEEQEVATINKDNAVRLKGGVKSPILREVKKGEEVVILDRMDTWTKVKTDDSMMGYIENKFLSDTNFVSPIPKNDFVEPEYTSIHRDYKINLAWHAIYTMGGNDTFDEYTSGTKGINVISPTWFSLTDNEGNYTSFASSSYVSKAHNAGMEVWALLENLSPEVSTYEIMSYSSKRERLVQNLVSDVLEVGADGINLDFEQISYDAGEHYVQFIRELSVACRANNLVLSVDNYVPKAYTNLYNRKEQGVFADYVIIMGYDEHTSGSEEAGSVASIDFVLNGIEQTLSEVPSEKVINAVPFYTRVWKTNGGEVTSEALGMDAASAFVKEYGLDMNWDDECCQYYAEKQMNGVLYQVWLEENESIAAKLSVMDSHNLAGVAEWKLGFENSSVWDIIQTYVNK